MTAAGVSIAKGRVLPEWIDLNGHMNVAYYVLAFDLGVDALWEQLGITSKYVEMTRCSTFAVESHVTYQRELKVDEPYHITAQILAYDEKRIHQFQRMHHAGTSLVAATGEWMNLHVDLTTRRVTPFPRPILSALRDFTQRQGDLPTPVEVGQTIAVRNPIFSGKQV